MSTQKGKGDGVMGKIQNMLSSLFSNKENKYLEQQENKQNNLTADDARLMWDRRVISEKLKGDNKFEIDKGERSWVEKIGGHKSVNQTSHVEKIESEQNGKGRH